MQSLKGTVEPERTRGPVGVLDPERKQGPCRTRGPEGSTVPEKGQSRAGIHSLGARGDVTSSTSQHHLPVHGENSPFISNPPLSESCLPNNVNTNRIEVPRSFRNSNFQGNLNFLNQKFREYFDMDMIVFAQQVTELVNYLKTNPDISMAK